jgi:hypothetical protein
MVADRYAFFIDFFKNFYSSDLLLGKRVSDQSSILIGSTKLPELPPELAHRFVRHDLALKDIKAGLIIDLIPNAIPLGSLLCLLCVGPFSSTVLLSPQ